MDIDKKDLDKFWNISSLVPGKSPMKTHKNINTDTVEISFSHSDAPVSKDTKSSTVIKRYIDPLHEENKKIKREAFEATEEYFPESSLLHRVVLKKRRSSFDLYSSFLEDAKKYSLIKGREAPYVSFYSYFPQYDQLSAQQLSFYLWWRKEFREGRLIKTDLSYIFLYVYELINFGGIEAPEESLYQLAQVWNCYHEEFHNISGKLAVWICDFCLIHKLKAPDNISKSITKHTPSLKEFFVHIPQGDCESCVRSLLKYGTEYDYHTSKFANNNNIELFDRHVFGAMLTAVQFFSQDGKLLSGLFSEDSKLIRNSFEGALCTPRWKYEIEVSYSSFSRSNELRFIMGDIVKYAENKIRGFLGIKSKLSVYSIGLELQRQLDAYFDDAFSKELPISSKQIQKKQEYDVLYDTPIRPLSLENAKKIENASWDTTHDLLSAFEREELKPDPVEIYKTHDEISNNSTDLKSALVKYYDYISALRVGNTNQMVDIAKAMNMLPEAIVDAINEIAVEIIGDILIEDTDSGFAIVDCYLDML